MTLQLEPLAWDSEFFGFEIARVALDGATPADLRAVDEEARDLGIECLYGSLSPEPPTTTVVVQQGGWRFVEAGLMFTYRPTDVMEHRDTDVRIRRGTPDDLPALAEVIDLLAEWSRFAVDPRFGPAAARRMHHAWVARAASTDSDQWLLTVAEDDSGISAFLTQSASPVPRVDTIGNIRPGSGASHHLIAAAREWAGGETLYGGPIAARNTVALRWVENCGYRMRETTYQFHRWLDEDPGPRS